MAPDNGDSFWFTTLCNQIHSLCSDVDDTIPEEPIQYVRNQILTAGENILQFYREFVDCVSPPVVNAPTHPIPEQHCHVTTDLPDDHTTKLYAVKFASPSSSNEPVVMICTENHEMELIPEQDDEMVNNHSVQIVGEVDSDAHPSLSRLIQSLMADLSEEIDEGSNNFPEVISSVRALSTQACDTNDELAESILSNGPQDELSSIDSSSNSDLSSDEYISAEEESDYCITELSERDMLDKSTIVVDITDLDIENAGLSTISEDIDDDEETGDCAKERVTWDDDSSDSDWEFVCALI